MVIQQEFNGYRFTRDKRGYYLSTKAIKGIGKRELLHRYMWMYYNGEILDGNVVHHIDENKDNNSICNLTVLPKEKHSSIHSIVLKNTPEWKAKWEELRQMGSDTHKHPEAREMQSKRAKQQWEKRKQTQEPSVITCVVCGNEKETYYPDRTIYCGEVCKAKAQRDNYKEKHGYGYHRNRTKPAKPKGVITCSVCGEKRETHYLNSKYCSKKCQMIAYNRRKRIARSKGKSR